MLLAAPLGENPREVGGPSRCRARARARRRERQRRADRGRRAGLRQPLPLRRLVPAGDARASAESGEGLGPAPVASPRADPGRVRLRQPDRAAARRRRPPRRLRGRARPPAQGGRPRGRARVLRQRRRRAGAALRRLARRRDGRRRVARGRLRAASTSPSWPSGSRPTGSTLRTPTRSGGAASSWSWKRVRATLDRFGVRFDNWFSERDLYTSGEVERRWRASSSAATPTAATARCGCARTEFGDDKDRVLIRADGEPTYLAADVAYHWDKLERGFEPADQRARRGPPWLRPPAARGDRRARRRPRGTSRR